MDWITKLERRYGRYAISGIMKYVIVLQVIGFVMIHMSPTFFYSYCTLDAGAILHGQVWRVITFLMDPPSSSPIFLLFACYLYYMIGDSLENIWGVFRFNVYLISGILFHVIAALLVYFIFGASLPLGTEYLYLSLFFAFVMTFPNTQFLLFFIIPVKAKYLGILNGIFFGYTVLQGVLPSYAQSPYGIIYKANAVAAVVSILNFLIFYFTSRNFKSHSPKQMMRKQKFKREVNKARRPEHTYANGAKHRCAVCGRTELDDPMLEFRYCSKCKGNREYCQEHLFTHQHMQ